MSDPQATDSASLEHRRTANRSATTSLLGGIVGGTLGGVAGYFAFLGIRGLGWGLYPLILPGAILGIGCGALTGRRSIPMGLLCAVAGLAAGVLTEWKTAPFLANPSLGFFIGHLGDLQTPIKAQLAFGTLFAFWFGIGRKGGVWRHRRR